MSGSAGAARRRRRELSNDEVEALVEAYKAGASTTALADDWQLPLAPVRELLTQRTGPLRVGRRVTGLSTSSERQAAVEQVVAWYASGRSIEEIAAELNTSPAWVSQMLHNRGVRLRGRRARVDVEAVRRLWSQGWTAQQIAEELGTSLATVHNYTARVRARRGASPDPL